LGHSDGGRSEGTMTLDTVYDLTEALSADLDQLDFSALVILTSISALPC